MDNVNHTSKGLRGLVNELDEKLADARPSRMTNPDGIEVIGAGTLDDAGARGELGRAQNSWPSLVRDLDEKLAASRPTRVTHPDGIEIIPERRIRGWLGIVLVTLLAIGIGIVAVQPWQIRCTYGRDLCAVAELDIDAIRITVPDSQLIAALPDIDAIDPDDELTAGEILAMDRFAHLDFAELLTDDDIDRLLAISG